MRARLLAALAVLTLLPTLAAADQWRIATLAPEGSAWMKVLSRGAAKMEEATAGRVTVKYYAGGVQGDEKDAVRKMGLGAIDGAALTSVGLSLIEPSIRVLELPRLFTSEAELDYVRNKMWPMFQKRFLAKGYRLSEPGDVGFVYLYSKKPIKNLKDLQSAKLWQWSEDALSKKLFSKLKLTGVPLGVPQVLAALTTNRIDTAPASPLALVALQWHTKFKYSTSEPLSYAIGASLIKAEKWNAMSKADQEALVAITVSQGKKLRKIVRKNNRKAKKTVARSIKEIQLSPESVKQMDETAREVWQAMAGKLYSKSDLDMVLKFRAEYRAKN